MSNVHPMPERELDLNGTVARLKQHRAGRIKEALHHYQLAIVAVENARRAEEKARKEKEHWFRQLRESMDRCERVVIGDTLITRHDNGGVMIEAVSVLTLL